MSRDHYKGVPKTREAVVDPNGVVLPLGLTGKDPVTPRFNLAFVPGHPDGASNNRHVDWKSLFAVADAYRTGSRKDYGKILIDFDFSHVNGTYEVPDGEWNVGGMVWTNTIQAGFNRPLLTFADGASLVGESVLTIEGYGGFSLVNDSLTNTPIVLNNFFSIVITGKRTEMFSRVSGAAPLIKIAPTAAFAFIYCSGANAAGSIGNGAVNPAPVIDLAGRFLFLGIPQSGIDDNVITDSVGGGVLDMSNRGFPSQGRNGNASWRQDTLDITSVINWEQHAHPRWSLANRGNRPNGTSFTTRVPVRHTPYLSGGNEPVLVDTAYIGEPVSGSLTFTNATGTISGTNFTKFKKGAEFSVTHSVSNNDTFTAASDGTKVDIVVNEAVTDEGPVTASGTATKAEVYLPPATPLTKGEMMMVKAVSDSSACQLDVRPFSASFATANGLPGVDYNLAAATDGGTITSISGDGLSITVNLDGGAPTQDQYVDYVLVFPAGSFGGANEQSHARRVITANTAADPSVISIDGPALSAGQQSALIDAQVEVKAVGADDKIDGAAGPITISQSSVNKSSGAQLVSDGGQIGDIGTWWSH